MITPRYSYYLVLCTFEHALVLLLLLIDVLVMDMLHHEVRTPRHHSVHTLLNLGRSVSLSDHLSRRFKKLIVCLGDADVRNVLPDMLRQLSHLKQTAL